MVLDLAQIVAERTDTLRLLEEAYDARLGIAGERAVVLNSMLEAARAKGFCGSLELAAAVLRVSGRFRIEKGPMDNWHAIRQSTALVPVALEPRSTALVPFGIGLTRRTLAPVAVDSGGVRTPLAAR
ncbi:MAG: hypothetical protein ACLQNE_37515 [Thermoguttaceae bacterium]